MERAEIIGSKEPGGNQKQGGAGAGENVGRDFLTSDHDSQISRG